MKTFFIAGRPVGREHPCLIVAEAGVNHNGSLDTAIAMIDAAQVAGADAVKFQTFKTERLVTRRTPKADYQKNAGPADESQFDMLKKLELSESAHEILMNRCRKKNLIFLSTPFDETCADFLDRLGVPAFKIGSGDLNNLPLLAHVARKRKPMLLSTGMAVWGEIAAAVDTVRREGTEELAVLHCVSQYPAEPASVNLRAMGAIARRFAVVPGYSDHTEGIAVAIAAVALGACVIEKHFTLDRSMPGPDHQASIEPNELAELIRGVRTAQASLGRARKRPTVGERSVARVARKSLVASRDLAAGAVLTPDDIAIKRPGTGLAPIERDRLIGRCLRRPVSEGDLLQWNILEPAEEPHENSGN